jgi:hypothetical protein
VPVGRGSLFVVRQRLGRADRSPPPPAHRRGRTTSRAAGLEIEQNFTNYTGHSYLRIGRKQYAYFVMALKFESN